MQGRLSGSVAVWMLIVAGWSSQMTMAGEPGRLAALAARQDLYDEVCIAKAEGKISLEIDEAFLPMQKGSSAPRNTRGSDRPWIGSSRPRRPSKP